MTEALLNSDFRKISIDLLLSHVILGMAEIEQNLAQNLKIITGSSESFARLKIRSVSAIILGNLKEFFD